MLVETARSTRRMEMTIGHLFEIYEQMSVQDDLLTESLRSQNMSVFLFEADEKAAVDAIESAVDAVEESLDNLDKTSDALGIPMIKDVAGDLRSKLTRLTVDPDAFGGVRAMLGQTTKQLTFLGNSIDGINKSIFEVCRITARLLKQSKLDPKSNDVKNAILQDLAANGKLDGIKNDDDLLDLLSKKMGETVKGKAKGFLASLMAKFVAAVEPITLEPRKFVAEFVRVPIEKIVGWAEGSLGQAAVDPPPSANPTTQLAAAARAADTTPAQLAAEPPRQPAAAPANPEAEIKKVANAADEQTLGKSIKAYFGSIVAGASDDDAKSAAGEMQKKLTNIYGSKTQELSNALSTELSQLSAEDAEKMFGSEDKRTKSIDALKKILDDATKLAERRKLMGRTLRESQVRSPRVSLISEARWAQLAGIREGKR